MRIRTFSSTGRQNGFTLIELLVGFVLLGLLSMMFVWFIVPVMRMVQLGTTRVDIQQMAVLACNRIAADLQRSAPSGVSLHSKVAADPGSEPVVVGIVPIDDVDEEGRRVWDTEVIAFFWRRESKKLFRRAVHQDGLSVDLATNRPTTLPTVDLIAVADPDAAKVVPIATRVVSFDTTQLTGGRAFAIDISLEEGVSGKHKPERFDYRKVVSLRN